jgi:hypothetical protein
MERSVIETRLYIPRNLTKYFALAVKYLQKGTEKANWQMMGSMIGGILARDLKSMKQVQIMS